MTYKTLLCCTAIVAVMLLMAGCEKDLPVYNTAACHLNFYYPDAENSLDSANINPDIHFSFVYGSSTATRDTLWLEVETMGFVSKEDRPVLLQQIDTIADRAIAGKHYIAFDDPSLASYYKIPAGKAQAKLPIILLRDPSLKTKDVTLTITFGDNGFFTSGYKPFSIRTITISDRLSKPTAWDYVNMTTYLSLADYYGNYGRAKHQFLIDETGEKWDDDYIRSLVDGDQGYFLYLYQKLVNRLDEVNAQREAEGLGVLSEDDGTPVVLQYGM